MRSAIVMSAKTPSNANRIAPRYCLRASCRVTHVGTETLVGEFVCYGKTPDIGRDVLLACTLYVENEPLVCSDVELVLFEECPVECVRNVTFTIKQQ
jgi:hypothetical protein